MRAFCWWQERLFPLHTLSVLALTLLWSARLSAAANLAVEIPKYTIDTWQVEEGLPQISVTSIVQDPEGYLWLGTFNGLARFDGIRFTVFDEGNTPSLGNSRIVRLDVDALGGMWIITEDGGLTRLWNGHFSRMTAQEGLPQSGAAAVIRGPQNSILLVDSQGGVFRFAGEKWVPEKGLESVLGNRVSLFTDGEGSVWAWFRQKRTLGRMVDGQLLPLKKPGETEEVKVRAFALSRQGGLWLVVSNRIWHCLPQRAEWKSTDWELPESARGLTHLLEDRLGNLWLGTYSQGLLRFGPSGICEQYSTREGLSHNTVRALCEDREGSLWVGTDGGGLNRLKPRIINMCNTRQGLNGDVVMSMAQNPQDVLWAGINGGGVSRIHQGHLTPLVQEPLLRTNSFIYGLFADRRNGLWIGTYDEGILYCTNGVVSCLEGSKEWAGRPLLTGLEDKQGKIWLGGGFGLLQWQDGQFIKINSQLGWSNVVVRALAEDLAGTIFAGSFGQGLNRCQQGSWKHFQEKDGLADNHVTALLVDRDDTLWIGTANGGLNRLRGDRFSRLTLEDGLPSNSINTLLRDDFENLWLGSNRGLIRISLRELNAFLDGHSPADHHLEGGNRSRQMIPQRPLACEVFTRADGLNSIECNGGGQPCCAKTSDGKLWFATVKGIAVIDPNHLPVNPLPPPVVIEEVILDEKTVINFSGPVLGELMVQTNDNSKKILIIDPASNAPPSLARIRKSNTLLVPTGKHRVEFRFTGLSFMAPEKVRFRYRLKGLEEKWLETGQRAAAYASLPQGRYQFEVTACNNDGVWSSPGAVLQVLVLPHIWQTGWFKAVVLFGLLGGTGWLVQRISAHRMQLRIQRLEQQHDLQMERTRIAQDIHDDLGARLTQIGLMTELARRNAASPEDFESDLQKISTLTRGMTQAMDEIVWAVDPAKDTLEGLLNYLASLSEEMVQGSPMRCRLNMPVVLSSQTISAKARHSIVLVVKEALNNCLKYSDAKEVWIHVRVQGTVLRIQIEDRGRGFKDRGRNAGRGLQNMRQRIEALGGALAISSQPGQGTRIQLKVDLSLHSG